MEDAIQNMDDEAEPEEKETSESDMDAIVYEAMMTIEIPQQIDLKTVTGIERNDFDSCNSLTNITVLEGSFTKE